MNPVKTIIGDQPSVNYGIDIANKINQIKPNWRKLKIFNLAKEVNVYLKNLPNNVNYFGAKTAAITKLRRIR